MGLIVTQSYASQTGESLVAAHCIHPGQMSESMSLVVAHYVDSYRAVDMKSHPGSLCDDCNGCHQYRFERRCTLTFAYHLKKAMLAHCYVNDNPHVGSVHHSTRHDLLFRGSDEAELDVETALLLVSEMGVEFHCVMKNAYHPVFGY